MLPQLEQQYQTTVLDIPGYGKNISDTNTKNIDEIADALIPKIKKESIIGGWSLGGMLAIRIASKLKERIRALVLIASTPCFVKKRDWPHGVDVTMIEEMSARIICGEKEKVLKEFALLVAKGDVVSKKIIRQLHSLLTSNLSNENALVYGLDILMKADLREELQQLKSTIVLLQPENDQLIMKSTGEAVKKINPGLRLEYIKASGHAPFLSSPKELCNILNSCLGDIH